MRKSFADLREALANRYDVDRVLGGGGMATVYLAQDRETSVLVAIKVLRPELAAMLGPTRFRREIEILTRLRHPNILPILDSDETGPFLYYVMPYIAGDSLKALVEREGPLPLARVLQIVRDLAAAIDYAHGEGILHRDIKPENVLLEGNRGLVCDFGLARAIDRAALEPVSSSGLVIGTPAYMSPEQAMGEMDLGAACDIYALGCVVYEMLTGELPFSGPTSQSIIARQISEHPRSIRTVRPDVTPEMELAVLAALAKEPDARPGSGAAFIRLMRGAV
jgi:eukaryotic-like serine/threonine-protein kinase